MPSAEAVTFTEIVQLDGAAARLIPDKAMLVPPATAVTVLPIQPLTIVGEAAITRPPGRPSVKPRPLTMGALAPLVTVKVSVEIAPKPIAAGENVLVNNGGLEKTTDAFTPVVVIPMLAPEMLPALVLV